MADISDLEYFWDLFNESDNATENATLPSYVNTLPVTLCSKSNVNRFGAKFIPVFYFTTFGLGFLGNGLVLAILFKYEKLQTVTNIFLLNLVLSNLIFVASLPFWATYHLSQWIFGSFMCKAVGSAYLVSYNSSILFLTLMTFDRYLAVVHAITSAKCRKKLYAVVASVIVWLLSIAASMKEIVLRSFSLFFLIPMLLVMFCYASITVRIMATRMKEKCRTIKLIFVIILTFFAFWTPYNIVCLLRGIQLSRPDDASSPVFYTFVGKKFQSHFRRLVGKHAPCLKRRLSLSSQSSRTTSQKTPHSTNQASAFSLV
ncbi:hypothetical protein WMY93_000463 [Mugilogobius chulae]|uniref:G-protein coupled receptors family 1 profile domain-containing protein n=1 Tax=Mugilogobius chulae TaxID=88201 RepID=A0AAW0Q9H6_9GOBI